jgi:putative ABC transport system permease protein
MPDWKRYLRKNLSLPVMKGHRDERAIEEMADHMEDLYREALLRGVSSEEAEAFVLGWVGDPERAASEILASEPGHVRAQVDRWLERREEDLKVKGSFWAVLGDGLRDLRLALRALAKRPLFSGVVILVLALGIGATSAIFTLVDAIVLSPLPFPDSDRLVAVQHAAPAQGMSDAGQCAAWHFTYVDEARAFQELGMFSSASASVTGSGAPEALPVLQVTEGVLPAVRLTPVVGRIFAAEDMDPDGQPTVMLGEGYWQSRFGGDPAVVGQTLQVDGVTREIIGVAPAGVRALGMNPSLILPLRFRRTDLFVGNIGYNSVARLNDGFSIEEAAADLNRVLPLAWEKFPGGPVASSDDPSFWTAEIYPLKDDLVGPVAGLLWVLLGGVGVVLLIACANVANLFLVRADGKEGEMAVRTAMGASGPRIGWEYLKESLLLGLMGGAVGLVLAQVGLRSLLAMAPANLPRLEEVTLDSRVVLFTLVVSLGSGLLFGLIPMLRHRREELVDALKEGGRGGMRDRGRHHAQNVLAISQMALALVLLVAAGLMLRSFQSLRRVDPGFRNPEDVLVLRLYIPPQEIRSGAEVAQAYESMVRRLEEIPGVSSVALATQIPMAGGNNVNPFFVRGQATDPDRPMITRRHKWIGGGYLETMRISLLAGRSITWDDVHDRAPVALLSESLAREVFGSPEAAVGQYVAARPDPPVWKEVVGVVKDVREDGLDRAPPMLVYWPQVTLGFWEGNAPDEVQTWRGSGLAIRSDRIGTPGFREAVEQAIWEVNPNLPLVGARPLSDLMASSMARTSFTMILLGIAGVVALILGLVGVYGVISYAVSQRSRELGMRMALGAEAGRVMLMVVRQGAVLAGVGVIIGLGLALGVTRLMSAVLVNVSPADPTTFASVAGGLLFVALLASYLPARRAARVDPILALRAE